ncbi:hypothetical protein ACKKBF_B04220 [Auxenochlorella protothecoides x Auxenochlorella symbiontica]
MSAMHAVASRPSALSPLVPRTQRHAGARRSSVATQASQKPPIMVNSCSGKMGHAAAEAAVRAGLTLVPFSYGGPTESGRAVDVGGVQVTLVHPDEKLDVLHRVREEYPGTIMVDYTLPSVVNGNATFYSENSVPFVMGTTGGDRDKIMREATESGVYAVIAPNMGKQIVALQTMLELMAAQFPGCLSGYTLRVVESHQATKADASGTAIANIHSFQRMGLEFDLSNIELVREAAEQIGRMQVPEDALSGHAFHTYTVTSPDGSVTLEFKHNVVGRRVYAEGTVDAALFLASKIGEGAEKRLYNMVDVLSGGNMRS